MSVSIDERTHARIISILRHHHSHVPGSGSAAPRSAFPRILWRRGCGVSNRAGRVDLRGIAEAAGTLGRGLGPNCTRRSYSRTGTDYKAAISHFESLLSHELIMKHPIHQVTAVSLLGGYSVRVEFEDHSSQTIDFE